MKKKYIKHFLMIALILITGATVYKTSESLTLKKGTTGDLPQSFVINNLVTFPMITLSADSSSTGFTDASRVYDATKGLFSLGTVDTTGVKLTGRLKVLVEGSISSSLGFISTVSLKINSPTVVVTREGGTETLTFNVGLNSNNTNTLTLTTLNSLGGGIATGTNGDQIFTAYIYFESTVPITSGLLPDGTYVSASSLQVQAFYD